MMMIRWKSLGWAVVALACLPTARAAAPATPATGAGAALACLILPEQVADIGSQVVGVIEWVGVERGDRIRKGQVVARLRADVERASSTVARSRADSEGDLRGAMAQRDLARLKLDRTSTLAQQNYVSAQAVEQARTEWSVADERVNLARETLRTTSREVSVSQAQLSQRQVRSPIDGWVVERYLNPGERIEDKPVLRVAHIAALRVEVVAPLSLFGVLRLGQVVNVQPDLPGSAPRAASVTQIDKLLDPASNTFRVRLSLANPDETLPAGLRCRVDLTAPR